MTTLTDLPDRWSAERRLADALTAAVPGLTLDHLVDALFRLDLTLVPRDVAATMDPPGFTPPAFTADALFERVGRLVNDHDWLTANILIGLIHDIAPLPEVVAYRALIGYLEALDGADLGNARNSRVKQTAWDMESEIRARVFKLLTGPS